MYWLIVMLVIGIVIGRLSHRYNTTDITRESRGGGLFLVTLAALPLLTACGGGGDDDVEMETPPDQAASGTSGDLCGLAVLFLADPNSVCSNRPASNSQPISPIPGSSPTPPPPVMSTPSAPPPPPEPIRILGNDEFEPNDDPINANVPSFAVSTGRVGFYVDGTVSDDDIHDTFTFVRPRAADFNIELCPPEVMICEQTLPIDTGTAFYEVLDQDGNIVKSSADDATNFGRVRLEAGVTYYVRVVAGDTMGGTIGYRLTAYETN